MDNYSEGLATGMALTQGNGNNGCYTYGIPAMPVMPYASGYGMGCGGFGGGWGNDWIGLIILAALFGWGGNGFGFGGGRGNMAGLATTADVASGFSTSEIMSDLNDIILQTSQGFASVQQTLCQGFSGVNATVNTVGSQINQGICNLGYTIQGAFNDLSHQVSDCCCTTQRGLDSINYNIATQACDIKSAIFNSTRDIVDSQRDGTQAILTFLNNEKICALQAENTALKGQISNDRQTANIVSTLRDSNCPLPAYLRADPNCCFNPFTYYNQNNNSCCGNNF